MTITKKDIAKARMLADKASMALSKASAEVGEAMQLEQKLRAKGILAEDPVMLAAEKVNVDALRLWEIAYEQEQACWADFHKAEAEYNREKKHD